MNNNKYIALLKQYQAGTISETDRHVLERAALDDPFLFDAMEGYSVYGSSVDPQNINALKKSESSATRKIRWLNIRNLTVAASLVALLTITFLMKNQLHENVNNRENIAVASNDNSDNNAPIAQTWSETSADDNRLKTEKNAELIYEELEIEESEMTNDEELATTKIGDANATATTEVEVTQDIKSSPPPRVQSATPEYNIPHDIEEKLAYTEAITPESKEMKPEPPKVTKDKISPNQKKRSSKAKDEANAYAKTDNNGEYILGKVLDIDGNQLIGASVYIENTEIGSVTDINGNFKLPKYGNGHQIVVNYTGYKPQKTIIGDLDFYQIVLPVSENTLSEVLVTRPKEVDKNKAFPAMGMEDFEIYVNKNKKYPLEVFGTTKSGTFKVSFNVNEDGSLSNFIDESENCDECFKEAVRLLEESGKWETMPAGQLYRTSYLFEF